MKNYKETKYLDFKIIEEKPKTLVVGVFNKSQESKIGEIRWYAAWRQYCFFPGWATIWNKDCLNDIVIVINKLMDERKAKRLT